MALVSGLCIALIVGCGGSQPDVQYAPITDEEPPDPLVEVLPPPSGPSRVWINGYWFRTPGGYVWVAGHWAVRPGSEYIWRRSGWVRVRDGYRFYPGRWVLRSDEAPEYVHEAGERRQGEHYEALTPADLQELMQRMGPLPRVPPHAVSGEPGSGSEMPVATAATTAPAVDEASDAAAPPASPEAAPGPGAAPAAATTP